MEKSVVAKQNGITTADDHSARPIYVVLGMHRSGTSLCSSISNMLGIDMAEEGGGWHRQRGRAERGRLVEDCAVARTQAAEQAQQLQAAAAPIGHLENSLRDEREQTAQHLRDRDTLDHRLTILHDSLADHHSAYKLLEQRLLG